MYSRVRVGEHLSDMFPIRNGLKQGDALSPLLYNFALQYAIRRVQVIQDGLKLNDTHQLLVYADVVIGWRHIYYKDKHRTSVLTSKETKLAVNAEKTKYMFMFWDQSADEVTVLRLSIVPLKGWNSSNISKKP